MSAVDSRELDLIDRSLVVPDRLIAQRGHWPGVAACSLSHLAAYRRVFEEDLPDASFWKTTYLFLMTWWT